MNVEKPYGACLYLASTMCSYSACMPHIFYLSDACRHQYHYNSPGIVATSANTPHLYVFDIHRSLNTLRKSAGIPQAVGLQKKQICKWGLLTFTLQAVAAFAFATTAEIDQQGHPYCSLIQLITVRLILYIAPLLY